MNDVWYKAPNERQRSILKIMSRNNTIISSYMIKDDLIVEVEDMRKSIFSRKWFVNPEGKIRRYIKPIPDFIDVNEFKI